MTDIWTSPAWTVVATVAQVVSLLALVIALGELRLRRRREHEVVWIVSRKTDVQSQRVTVEILNAGRSLAQIKQLIFVDCRIVPGEEKNLRWVVAPSTSLSVPVESHDVESCWILIGHVSQDDRRWTRWTWYPIGRGFHLERGYAVALFNSRFKWIKNFGRINWAWLAVERVGPYKLARSRTRNRSLDVEASWYVAVGGTPFKVLPDPREYGYDSRCDRWSPFGQGQFPYDPVEVADRLKRASETDPASGSAGGHS